MSFLTGFFRICATYTKMAQNEGLRYFVFFKFFHGPANGADLI